MLYFWFRNPLNASIHALGNLPSTDPCHSALLLIAGLNTTEMTDKFVALTGLVTSYHSDYSAGMCVRVFMVTSHLQLTSLRHCRDLLPHIKVILHQVCVCARVCLCLCLCPTNSWQVSGIVGTCDLIPQRLFSGHVCWSVCLCLSLRPTNSWQVSGIVGTCDLLLQRLFSRYVCVSVCLCLCLHLTNSWQVSGIVGTCDLIPQWIFCRYVWERVSEFMFMSHQQLTSLRRCRNLWPHTTAIIQRACVLECVSVFIITSHQQLTSKWHWRDLWPHTTVNLLQVCVWACVWVYV